MAVFSKKIAKNSPPGPHTCHHFQNVKNVQNIIQMALIWQFFPKKKIARIAPWLRASPPGPHTCHFIQNVIQKAI